MKRIIFMIPLLLLGFTHAQTTLSIAENYIYEKNCLNEDCSKKTESVQYFDGLGRAKQNVSIKATPSGKDIAVAVEYDPYGRQVKNYLPVPQSGTQNGAIYTDPLSNAPAVYGNEKIYSEKVLEESPLQRVLRQKPIGHEWSAHPAQFSYALNTTADAVQKYEVTTTWTEGRTAEALTLSGNYPANSLYKSTVTDEDGNKTTEFKNRKGQSILIRKNDGTRNVDTYYVYNEFGKLAYTLPPLAAKSDAITQATLDNLCYQYRYDGWNRLVEKKIPGKGWEYMVYDKQDRLVLAQDANLRTATNNFAAKGWMFTKYDLWGRVVYTGFFSNTATRLAMQTAVNSMNANSGNNETRSDTSFFLNGMDVYYTKNAFPTGSMRILSVNYYDTYPSYSFNPPFPSVIMGKEILSDNSTGSTLSTKGLSVMSMVKNIENDNWTKNYVWYDSKGRAIGTYSVNHLGGFTQTETDLDFAGVMQKNTVYQRRKANESGVTVKQRFIYDTHNRLLQHYHQVDGKPEQLLSENTYNELSQLVNKKVGNSLQSTDYSYNIRGWMTEVNKNQMALPDLGGKLFSYRIKYNQKDGISNPDPTLFPGKNVTARYGGNIAEVDWRTVETVGVNPSVTPKRYGYAYDSLNRLTAGYYQNPDNPYSKEHTESLSYDLNGNVTDLYRTSVMEYAGTAATVIDKLSYSYTGNQVTSILDVSQNGTGYEGGGNTVGYDVNGNMTSMPDKGISSVRYNYLNLPYSMNVSRMGNEELTIITGYRANGTKLRKENTTVTTGFNGNTTTVHITDYLDGFQYFSSSRMTPAPGDDFELMSARAMQPQAFSISERKTLPPAKTPDLQFFPTTEGFYDYTKDQYIYQHKDHLGNVRVSFGRNSAGALEITDNNDYYPFGMNHLKSGTSFFGKGSYKNHKYNGKELQETGLYSYGWREYMPDIARWNGIDQLAESYLSTSTYAYVANKPLSYIDPDGRWMDEAGHIDTSGQANPFNGMSPKYKPAYMMSFMGVTANQGAGGGGYTFTGNAAASMFEYFANGGNINGLSFNNGWAMWSTLDASNNSMYNDTDGMLTGSTGGVILNRMKVSNESLDSFKDWVDYGSGTMGTMFETIVEQRTSLYNSGYWVDNLGRRRLINTFASPLRGSSANYLNTTTKFGKYAKRIGYVGYAINAYEVGEGLSNDGWRPGKNTVVAGAKVGTGLIVGAGVSAGVSAGIGWLSGAMAGAGVGSVAPGVGTVIGFIVGGVAGYFASEYVGEAVENSYK